MNVRTCILVCSLRDLDTDCSEHNDNIKVPCVRLVRHGCRALRPTTVNSCLSTMNYAGLTCECFNFILSQLAAGRTLAAGIR